MYWTQKIFQHVVEEDECGLRSSLSSVDAGGPLGICEDDLVFCFGLHCKVMSSPSPEGCKPRLENYY